MGQGKKLFGGPGRVIGLLLLALFVGHTAVLGAQVQRLPRQRKPSALTPSRRALTPNRTRDLRTREQAQDNEVPTVGTSHITLKNNQLSLDVRNQSMRAIIERIATEGGIQVRHLQETPDGWAKGG